MLEHIFGSKTRVKILRLFFEHDDQSFYLREIARLIGSQINAVRREIANLAEATIVTKTSGPADDHSAKAERRKYFGLNEDGVLTAELRALLIKAKFFSQQKLINQLTKLGQIDFLVISGALSNSKEAPTDLLIVGEISKRRLAELIHNFEKEFGEAVRYTAMKTKEFLYRRAVADRFLTDLLATKHLVAIDRLNPKT